VHDADTRVQPCTRLAGCHKPVATAPAAAQNALLLVVLVGFSSENFYPQLPIEMILASRVLVPARATTM
jgi:hypothetical protein